MQELEERVTELEIRLSHQTRLLEDLDQVVIEYNDRLTRLERENARLKQQLQAIEPEAQESPDE